jgi:hypothetical protein
MTIASQRFGKHHPKAGITAKSSGSPFAKQRFGKHVSEVKLSTVGPPLLSSRFLRFVETDKRHIITERQLTVRGGGLYSVLPEL